MTLFRVIVLACPLLVLVVGGNAAPPASPTSGPWKGLSPGEYVIRKHVYRGAKFRKDGEEYRKTVLLGTNKQGGGSYADFTANTPDGPWKLATVHADADENDSGADVQKKQLAAEDLVVSNQVIHCRVEQTTSTDDWGTTSRKQWFDKASGLLMKSDESFNGQQGDGRPWKWKLQRVTLGFKTAKVGTNEIVCFVQDQRQSVEQGEQLRWHELVAAPVPGQLVQSQYWSKQAPQPEIETFLVAWGNDPGLLAEYERQRPALRIVTDEEIEQQQKAEDAKREREVNELEMQTLADLRNPDPAKRMASANALGSWQISETNKARVIEALKIALADASPEVRQLAAWGLGRHGAKGLTPQIIELLKADPEGTPRYLEAIGLQADPQGLPVLLQHVSSTNEFWRKAAVTALGNYKTEQARIALERCVTDPSWRVRLAAVESLDKIANPLAVPALVRALQDTDPNIANAAIRAVTKLGDDTAVPPLLHLLNSPNDQLRLAVAISIWQMKLRNPRPVADALLPKLDDASVPMRAVAARGLGELRERRAIPKLTAMAQGAGAATSDWWDTQQMAVYALGKIGDPGTIPVLTNLLAELRLHKQVCEALAQMGAPAAKPLLKDYFLNQNDPAREQVLEALAQVGTSETVSALEQYLRRCPPREKRAVRETIQQIDARLRR